MSMAAAEIAAQDVRYALRGLRKNPLFTTVALLLLMLGIGANTAVFTVARQVLLHSLAVENSHELMQLKFDDLPNHVVGTEFSYPAFQVFSQPNPLLSGIYARSEQLQVNVTFHGSSNLARAVFESPGAASVLGIAPALGRLLNPGDARPSGESPPAILSDAYWRKRFGGDPNVIGRAVAIDTLPFVIAGVTPSNFHGVEVGVDPDVTLPAYAADAIRGIPTTQNRSNWAFAIVCRVRPGATPEQVRASLVPAFAAVLNDFVSSVHASMTATMKPWASKLRLRVDSASLGASSNTRDRLRQPLTILIVITGLVFLVTCANLAGLMLAKTETRTAEIGIRLAIGCSRSRLLRQLLTESTLIAVAGAVCGVLAAFWTGPLVLRLLGNPQLSDSIAVHPDASTLAYGLALAVVGAVLLGFTPALRAAQLDPLVSIRHSSAASGLRSSGFARTLIVCQIAASLVLSLTAGQFIRSLENYHALDAGFRPDHLIAISVRPDLVKYDNSHRIAYARQMYARLAALPAVKSVTFSTSTFGELTWTTLVTVPGHTPTGTLDDTVGRNIAGPRFIETLGLKLVAGRDFDMRDTASAPATVVVNQSFARRFFATDDILGRQIYFIDSPTRPDTIVGIVRDARDRGVKEPPKPAVYSNYERDPLGWLTFSLRVARDPKPMLHEVVSIFRQMDPQVPIDRATTAEAQMDEALQRDRALAALSAMLGTVATVIAMVGLYGLLAWSVVRRTREIGIRIALGAQPNQVRWLAVSEGARLLLYGIALACPAWLTVSRLFRAQIYQVKPDDPLSLCGSLLLLTVCAGLATYIPASRCASINPVTALKYD